MPRPTPVQARSKRTVDNVLAAAETVFACDGFAAATMTAVATEAGVGIATLYQWFPTKDDLVEGLAERHVAASSVDLVALAARLREEAPPLPVVARRFVDAVVAANAGDAGYHGQLFDNLPSTPAMQELSRALRGAMADELAWHLERTGTAAATARVRSIVAVHALDAVVHHLATTPPPKTSRKRIADEAVALLLGYVDRADASS